MIDRNRSPLNNPNRATSPVSTRSPHVTPYLDTRPLSNRRPHLNIDVDARLAVRLIVQHQKQKTIWICILSTMLKITVFWRKIVGNHTLRKTCQTTSTVLQQKIGVYSQIMISFMKIILTMTQSRQYSVAKYQAGTSHEVDHQEV